MDPQPLCAVTGDPPTADNIHYFGRGFHRSMKGVTLVQQHAASTSSQDQIRLENLYMQHEIQLGLGAGPSGTRTACISVCGPCVYKSTFSEQDRVIMPYVAYFFDWLGGLGITPEGIIGIIAGHLKNQVIS